MKLTNLFKYALLLATLLFFYACSCEHENTEEEFRLIIFDRNSLCYIEPEDLDVTKSWFNISFDFLSVNEDSTDINSCVFSSDYLDYIEPVGGINNIVADTSEQVYTISLNPNDTQSTFVFHAKNGETESIKFEYAVEEKYYRSCGQYHVTISDISIIENTFATQVTSMQNNWIALFVN